jgi:hypothetical protein
VVAIVEVSAHASAIRAMEVGDCIHGDEQVAEYSGVATGNVMR